jgi:hypothetical protein
MYETDGQGNVSSRDNVSTDQIVEEDVRLDDPEYQQDKLDPRERKRQISAKNGRRKQDEMRRTELAEKMAKAKRDDMLRHEFLQLVDMMKNQKDYSFEEFLELEKNLRILSSRKCMLKMFHTKYSPIGKTAGHSI